MKHIIFLFILLTTLCPFTFAQPSPVSISQQLHSFSPMAQIYLKQLGLSDRNNNGVIDRGAGEGYEAFTAQYGNADVGFYANGITQSANNGKLEEPEIINHYYISIRFKPDFQKETTAIEDDVKAYIYANNIPLVWLDDQQGTVMKEVNRVLGEGWQDKQVSESEAEKMFQQAANSMNIKGLFGIPSKTTGYYTLSEFVNRKSGYCFEVAQFGFWFFSQLQIRSLVVDTALTPSLLHAVIKLNNSNTIIDYFKTSNKYRVPVNQWTNFNPIQSIGDYYYILSRTKNSQLFAEQSVIYNKYDIALTAYLINMYSNNPRPNHTEIIEMGEFILKNVDIPRVMTSDVKDINSIKNTFERILSVLIESYSATRNRTGFNNVERLLDQYYSHDPKVKPFLDYYRF
jgi:hypothetical protein